VSSCKESTQSPESENTTTEVKQETKPPAKKVNNNTNYLCKINGKDWSYTEASGIVDRHKKTGKRTAIITFKKKLEKGSETVQLRYDGDTYELEYLLAHLKLPKKEGGMMTGMFDFYPEAMAKNPNSEMSGKLDLTDPKLASGNAEFKNINMKFEKELLANPDDATISITDLSFKGIGYTNLDKAFNLK
jgi:hypothetical protein